MEVCWSSDYWDHASTLRKGSLHSPATGCVNELLKIRGGERPLVPMASNQRTTPLELGSSKVRMYLRPHVIMLLLLFPACSRNREPTSDPVRWRDRVRSHRAF